MKPRTVTVNDDPLVDWVSDPTFQFDTEVDASVMLQTLRDELRTARTQVRHIMRYMAIAVRTAHRNGVLPQTIIRESGLARRTVYRMIGKADSR